MIERLKEIIAAEVADIDPNSDTRTTYWDGRLEGLLWVQEQILQLHNKNLLERSEHA